MFIFTQIKHYNNTISTCWKLGNDTTPGSIATAGTGRSIATAGTSGSMEPAGNNGSIPTSGAGRSIDVAVM